MLSLFILNFTVLLWPESLRYFVAEHSFHSNIHAEGELFYLYFVKRMKENSPAPAGWKLMTVVALFPWKQDQSL